MLINNFSSLLDSRDAKISVEGEIRNKNKAVALTAAIETSWHALGKHILS